MSDGFQRLTAALGGVEPTGFEDVAADDLMLLAEAVEAALAAHASELERATLESLRFVPRVARPAVRRILGL